MNAPDTQIQVAPPSLAGSHSASFEFTASKAGTQFQCRLDGSDFSACTSPQQFGNLPEGTHTFEVRAFDSKGNVDGTPGDLHVDDRRDRAGAAHRQRLGLGAERAGKRRHRLG